jgi:hypothetical protein
MLLNVCPAIFSIKSQRDDPGANAFTIEGFHNWKKVNDGIKCAFLVHMGNDPCSPHNNAVKCCDTLLNQSQHIENVIDKQNLEQKLNNRLRLKTLIDCIRYLTSQGCALRGHVEGPDSKNRSNFLELIELVSIYNEKVGKIVLENAPQNAKYTSHHVQKYILYILAKRVRNAIREKISDSKFCIDEARDESKKEQMAIFLIFVDKDGFIQERLFDIFHVKDTSASTLMNEIYVVLSQHHLDIKMCMSNFRHDLSLNLLPQTFKGFDFKIFVDRGMMVLVIYVVNGKDYKHYFLMIVFVHTMFIVSFIDYN